MVTAEARSSLPSVQARAEVGVSFSAGVQARSTLPPLEAHATATFDAAIVKPLPAITLKTVVLNLGERTEHGLIVRADAAALFDIVTMLLENPSIAYELDWRKWEEIIAGAWERTGFFDKVELTPRSGDKGRDVIATKYGHCSLRIFDQVKANSPGHLVTAQEVHAMITVINLEHASKGYVTTTSDFAPGVLKDERIKPLIPHTLQLTNFDGLLDRLKEFAGPKE